MERPKVNGKLKNLESEQASEFLHRLRVKDNFNESPTAMEPSTITSSKTMLEQAIPDVLRYFELIKNGPSTELERLFDTCADLAEVRNKEGSDGLHVAVLENRLDVVDLLIHRHKNLNSTDSDGNTALNLSASKNYFKITALLLAHGANPSIKNDAQDTPLHSAVRGANYDSLKKLLASPLVNVNAAGWYGETALHVAASANHLDCAKLLISHHADIGRRSDNAALPIHVAAVSGSTDVLECLIQSCVDIEKMLACVDDEEATPLHLAVNCGDQKTVRILLQNGAPIEAQMFDLSTPLHLACTQGSKEIVEMFHTYNVVDFEQVLRCSDIQGMMPLHCAAMFNRWTLLRLLIDKNAPINARDAMGRTVLILAASRGSWDAVSELLSCGADPILSSDDGQNFLHYVIALGGDPETFKDEIQNDKDFRILLNGKDCTGYTPLHYAARSGFGKSSETLVRLGATVSAKGYDLRSPLHLAAMFGRYNTIKNLLASVEGLNVINDTDNLGRTSLHLSAENGHVKVVLFLLSKGALMLRDQEGKLPIHLASAADQSEVVVVLIKSHLHLIDTKDQNGNTPLHLAAGNNCTQTVTVILEAGGKLLANKQDLFAMDLAIMNKHEDVANAMVDHPRWQEMLLQSSSLYGWPSLGLIEHFPNVMQKALDKCRTESSLNPLRKDYFVTYNFKLLQPNQSLDKDRASFSARNPQPLEALKHMVQFQRQELLSHDVCTCYLDSKWVSYGIYFHIASLAIYTIFLTLLTYLIFLGIDIDLRPHLRLVSLKRIYKYRPEWLNATKIANVEITQSDAAGNEEEVTVVDRTLLVLMIIFALINLAKKVFQLHMQGNSFFFRTINLFELTLYITSLIFCIGFYDTNDYYLSWRSQWLLGAVAILFSWANLFFYLQRYGEIGMHVVILMRCMKTLTEAMMVLFIVVVAFSLTFYVLDPAKIFPENADFFASSHATDGMSDLYYSAYSTLQVAILRVSDQMIGDADVIVNFISPILKGMMIYPDATYIFALLSMAIVTILLQSLIIGLTVGEIKDIRGSVVLRRKAMQVELHTEIEEKIPARLMSRWNTTEKVLYPNRTRSSFLAAAFKYVAAWNEDDSGSTENGLWLKNPFVHWQKYASLLKIELDRQKKSVTDLNFKLEQQHELLRLIVQRMDINVEADIVEEEGARNYKAKLSRAVDGKLTSSSRSSVSDD